MLWTPETPAFAKGLVKTKMLSVNGSLPDIKLQTPEVTNFAGTVEIPTKNVLGFSAFENEILGLADKVHL